MGVGKVKGWRLQPTAVFNDPTVMAEKMDTGDEEGGDKGNLDYWRQHTTSYEGKTGASEIGVKWLGIMTGEIKNLGPK